MGEERQIWKISSDDSCRICDYGSQSGRYVFSGSCQELSGEKQNIVANGPMDKLY